MKVHASTLPYMEEESIEMSAADARRSFAEVLNAASARGRITYITSRGRRVAAVVPLAVAEQAEAAGKDGKDALH